MDHVFFMKEALAEAQKAFDKNETPIGAVAVVENEIVGRAHNLREQLNDPLGHAEIFLVKQLSQQKKSWRLLDVTLYVTLEPCIMCMGALLQSRIPRLIFGTLDPKAGACGSLYDLSQDSRLNHKITVISGILESECRQILKDFFSNLRKLK